MELAIGLFTISSQLIDIDAYLSCSYGWRMSTNELNRLRQRAFELDEEDRADLAYDLLGTISGPVEEANKK